VFVNPELPGHVLRSVLLSMGTQGRDVSGLMRHVRSQTVGGPRGRTSWEELVVVLEAFFLEYGQAATQSLMQELGSRHSSVRQVAELLGSPRLTYLVLFEALVARQAVVQVSWKSTPSNLSMRLELHRGLRPSLLFFQCCAWFLASIPCARGVAEARVQAQVLTPRELECVIVPPKEPELSLPHSEANVRVISRELFRFSDGSTSEKRTTPSVQALQTRFGLTRAEARVVQGLAEGRSVKRIAEELEVSFETARTHAKRAMQKTDTHRQAELVSLVLQGER
jgi:DNA-binding CsgD family transcriptional regulator